LWPVFPRERSSLSEIEGKRVLSQFAVPVVSDTVVQTREEAISAAERLGFPLVVKLISPEVAHKTEHGLVKVGLNSTAAVADAFDAMMTRARAMQVTVEGVTLEPMVKGGIEILVGITRDNVFGFMLTVGLGGVWTELMKDVRHRLLPVDAAGAEQMLRELKGFELLNGYRGAPKADVSAAARAIAAVCDAVLAGGDQVREVEVNPLLVLPEGRGAVAIDALVLLTTKSDAQGGTASVGHS
jgi:acetate---CoA ligase (ADP-forming)